jgi:hypothetical protein
MEYATFFMDGLRPKNRRMEREGFHRIHSENSFIFWEFGSNRTQEKRLHVSPPTHLLHWVWSQTPWLQSLLQLIATRPTLHEVMLMGPMQRNQESSVNTKLFLDSILKNASIHTMRLNWALVPVAALYPYLNDTTSSVTTLELSYCDFEGTALEKQELFRLIRQSMRINKLTLSSKAWSGDDDDDVLSSCYRHLASNAHVKELDLRLLHPPSLASSDALQFLVENSISIEHLTIYCTSGLGLCSIVRGLLAATTRVIDITFENCQFGQFEEDANDVSVALFKSTIQTMPCIRSLCLRQCSFPQFEPSVATFTQLLQQHAELRNFEVTGADLFEYGLGPTENFQTLLASVEKSKLESFSVGCICDEDMFHDLLRSIPKMSVKMIRFYANHVNLRTLERFKTSALRALKKNPSIHSVEGTRQRVDFEGELMFDNLFTWDDWEHLNYYAARNKGIEKLFSCPSSVPRVALPKALAVARATGPLTMYRILKVLGNSVGPVEGMRKRKHPIRYTPG